MGIDTEKQKYYSDNLDYKMTIIFYDLYNIVIHLKCMDMFYPPSLYSSKEL